MRLSRIAALLFVSFLTAGQGQAQPATPARPVYKPVYLLDSRVIIGENGLVAIAPDIESVVVYKGSDIPARWRGLAEHGIIVLTMKHRVKQETKTLASLSRWLKLTEPVRFELDSLPLEDVSLRIATAGIAGLDVTRATAARSGTVVNIRLVRTGPTPPADPAGPVRIFIRGTAGL
jgi:hypothetical protein